MKNISSTELSGFIQLDPSITLLDVREPLELMVSGAIEGAKNIPLGQLSTRRGELPEDTSVRIVVICASGSRSMGAAHLLHQLGYSNVLNLVGGTNGWTQSGFPVVRQSVRI